ncbi:MAG TPA: 16S rRNA (adenine(1518)-N(6)/adenine(1519)-N(6))-dimethyltransferase RsmA [Candidatus Saccharimonadales bacterium]|jgi:16S rRNA (adenine1518-N6/adenine1519-N6)-dimethyltransferase|nr:16S rRNA (adenine(1518)-N(6)/adenine(1519)-N(6))-dimethyltransferase RsmA [Candidatus Saccharimonadales bacterium]
MPPTKKSLGQHWLNDDDSLQAMCDAVDLQPTDTVLEVGPGPGALTAKLVARAARVLAVEFDYDLARDLPSRVKANNLEVIQHDILTFDFASLPAGYKVAANIPYYLTSNLLRVMCENPNHFSQAALLLQKEVAQRVCAKPGAMSTLSVSVQFYCEASLGRLVPRALFTPPPKVDSQILMLTYRTEPRFAAVDTKIFFRIVKAGFAQRRKTLLNSLGAGLNLNRDETGKLLTLAGIDPTARAQSLSLEQWHTLYQIVNA